MDVEAAKRTAIIDGGGSRTVGTSSPTVSISQTKMIQTPKNTGTARETIDEKACETSRAASDFSTAVQPRSQHAIRNGQHADAMSASRDDSKINIPARLAARSTRAFGSIFR